MCRSHTEFLFNVARGQVISASSVPIFREPKRSDCTIYKPLLLPSGQHAEMTDPILALRISRGKLPAFAGIFIAPSVISSVFGRLTLPDLPPTDQHLVQRSSGRLRRLFARPK